MRIALGIQYDGSAYHGWQSQLDGQTVQDYLERALSQFAQVPIKTIVAGRTDTGVHGLGQVVHFDTEISRVDFSWVRGTNTFLPKNIAVKWAKEMPEHFHARFSAVEREYYYLLHVAPVASPLMQGKVGWIHAPLNIAAMQEAAQYLIGEHDFSSFRSSECQSKTPIKVVYQIDIVQRQQFIYFRFRANAFLHHMVRNIMGSLLAIGRGRYPMGWMQELLVARDRQLAAPTFMAEGLYLTKVCYPDEFAVPEPVLTAVPWTLFNQDVKNV